MHKDLEQRRAYQKQWRKNNVEKMRAYRNAWKERNPDAPKIYYENNREHVIEKSTKWVHDNIDRAREIRRCAFKRWFNKLQSDPDKKGYYKYLCTKTYHKRKGAEGSYTYEQWSELLDKYNYACVGCLSKENITVDHKLPLSRGGTNNIDNLQPLCMQCNLKKHNKLISFIYA